MLHAWQIEACLLDIMQTLITLLRHGFHFLSCFTLWVNIPESRIWKAIAMDSFVLRLEFLPKGHQVS